MFGKGNIGVQGPFNFIPDSRRDAAHAQVVNRQEYFVHPERDPCGSTTDATVASYCSSSREFKFFRTHNGECNNLDNPRWGSVYSPLSRLLPRDHGKLTRPTHDSSLIGIYNGFLRTTNVLQA